MSFRDFGFLKLDIIQNGTTMVGLFFHDQKPKELGEKKKRLKKKVFTKSLL